MFVLNCCSMCPIGSRLSPGLFPPEIPCQCFLLEGPDGLILVDTGIGSRDLEDMRRWGPFRHFLNVQREHSTPAIEQVRACGYQPEDVRTIVPTHLDLDHAGGIADFPDATVHLFQQEYDAAHGARGFVDTLRYRAEQWQDHQHWSVHNAADGETWLGFHGVRALPGSNDEVLLVPLFGHTKGHMGVAVRHGDGWVFHVGDSYYTRQELELGEGAPLTLRLFQRLIHDNWPVAFANQQRLKGFIDAHPEVTVISAHDPAEAAAFHAQQPTTINNREQA